MTRRIFTPAAVAIVLLASVAAVAAETSPPATTFVRGFRGDPKGGIQLSWYTHLGMTPMYGVREQKGMAEMEWKSAPLPAAIPTATVTFVWSGAMGSLAPGGGFALFVNGHAAADCDVVLESAQFPCRDKACRLLYDVLYTKNGVDSAGHFFLTVPKAWVKPGEPAALQVKATERGAGTWFSLVRAEDAPLAIPHRDWVLASVVQQQPGTPPPKGEEASYDWYLRQYSDPGMFTPIGLPADAAEVVVLPAGQLERAPNNCGLAPIYPTNTMAFGLYEDGHAVRMGTAGSARQSLEEGCLPIVITDWSHHDIAIHEQTTAAPLRGAAYETGMESTLAWAVFDITDRGKEPRDITFFAAESGDGKTPKRNLSFHDGVVMDGGSARSCAGPARLQRRVPGGGAGQQGGPQRPAGRPPHGRAQQCTAGPRPHRARPDRAGGGEPRLRFPRDAVLERDGPQVKAEELTARSPEHDLALARSTWKTLAAGVSRLKTPDALLNNMAAKAMLDGYFLTKRWNGRYIVFDSVCYRCQWDDSSTKWFYALDLMGDHQTAGRLLETVFWRQGQRKPLGTHTHEGCFSDVTNIAHDGSLASWTACNGWALWAMAEHARLANDRQWLTAHKQAILAGCQWIIRERNFSKQQPNNPCRGLLHGKFVCDMPDAGDVKGVGYFAYTDAISYLGLHEMAQVLADWGEPEGPGLLAEAESYRRDIDAAMERLTDKSRDPWYVPWALHAPKYQNEYLNGVCGPINLAFARVLPRDDPRIAHVIRWNIDHVRNGSPEWSAIGSMFYSQDLAIVLLEQGRVEDFLRMFYSILAANVSRQTLTTCEWRSNTQPHIHSISSLIRMFRTMMVQERDGGLYLLQGTPRRWLEDNQQITIKESPTWYGPLSLDCVSHVGSGSVQLRLQVPQRLGEIPIHLKLRLPAGLRLSGVTVDGLLRGRIDGEWIVLAGLKGRVDIMAQTAAAPGK